jgi:hypothetical protein
LQAKNVGTNRLDEFGDHIDAQAHRIDIPACNGELHDQESVISNR